MKTFLFQNFQVFLICPPSLTPLQLGRDDSSLVDEKFGLVYDVIVIKDTISEKSRDNNGRFYPMLNIATYVYFFKDVATQIR